MGSLAPASITVGVLALQGAFNEHTQLLRTASLAHPTTIFTFLEVRTPPQLATCDALIIPGGESTAIALLAARSHLLEPLRAFVKAARRPTWGTCAGLILLAEAANRSKAGGQDLVGGLDVRVNRNHFGRQSESFGADLSLDFLAEPNIPFRAIFIRAPIVETLLGHADGAQEGEAMRPDVVVAPAQSLAEGVDPAVKRAPVEILATLPGRAAAVRLREAEAGDEAMKRLDDEAGDIVAVRQGNVFGTSFHPELTGDARIHAWWLGEVIKATLS